MAGSSILRVRQQHTGRFCCPHDIRNPKARNPKTSSYPPSQAGKFIEEFDGRWKDRQQASSYSFDWYYLFSQVISVYIYICMYIYFFITIVTVIMLYIYIYKYTALLRNLVWWNFLSGWIQALAFRVFERTPSSGSKEFYIKV